MSLATRTHFEVLGFEAQILGLEPYKSFENDQSSARGQHCFLIGQKENNQTNFFLNSGVSVARIFDWGAPLCKSHTAPYDVIRNFQTEKLFMGQKYLRMEDQKPGGQG